MKSKNKQFMWMVLLIATLMTIPFLWITDFNTKGEPREAIVAVSMLNEGNWILPVNNGGDISPYLSISRCITLHGYLYSQYETSAKPTPSQFSPIHS